MTDKRRYISLLPAINQTQALKNFFGVTIDELYQPGTPIQCNGYIGEFPPLYNVVWNENTAYVAGEYVIYENNLYYCNTNHTSGSNFNIIYWSATDFYITEPTSERQNYQLEPGMISTDSSDNITNALSYPDLINYLSNNNAVTNNQERLFETNYYSWCPPIDVDKFMNFSRYYWFGDNNGISELPALILASPVLTYTGNGITNTFTFPSSIDGIPASSETLAVYVNGVKVNYILNNNQATLTNVPKLYDSIVLTRFDNLYDAINCQENFPISNFISYNVSFTCDGYTPTFVDNYQTWMPSTAYAVKTKILYNNVVYICLSSHVSSETFNSTNWSAMNVDQSLVYYQSTNFSHPFLLEPFSYTDTDSLTTITTIPTNYVYLEWQVNSNYTAGTIVIYNNATYECIKNHVSSSSFQSQFWLETFSAITTPLFGDVITMVNLNGLLGVAEPFKESIISGLSNDLSLSMISTGMCVKLLDTSTYFEENFNIQTWVSESSNNYLVDNVGETIKLTMLSDLTSAIQPQYITINRASNDANQWSMHNFWIHDTTFAWSANFFSSRQASRPIIEFVKDIVLYNYGWNRISSANATLTTNALVNGVSTPYNELNNISTNNKIIVDGNYEIVDGSVILVLGHTQHLVTVEIVNDIYTFTNITQSIGDITDINNIDYWYNGTNWNLSQIWNESVPPLFMLYDIESTGNAFDDLTVYPNSNFNGNQIFGYYSINGTVDPVLNIPVNYDSNGYLMFENFTVPLTVGANTYNQYTYMVNGQTLNITSLACYGINTNGIITNSLWYPTNTVTTQTMNSNGFYEIPLNLQANPLWNDVTTLSKSDYAQHFTSIIANQTGFTGSPYYTNNFEDTAKDLSLGTSILQHQAPLLKTMLLASESDFDIPSAIKYAEQEYTRFKNKFAKKLEDMHNKGVLPTAIDSNGNIVVTNYTNCVSLALSSLIIDKNTSFPFWLSKMGGGDYFIPPTPAYLGVLPITKPSQTLITDMSYGVEVEMIQGHDGALYPAFGDWRDNVFIALETQIYNSINSTLLNQERPLFDIDQYVIGRFNTSENNYNLASFSYNLGEINSILSPMFEKWTQIGRFDFRTNGTYSDQNPFTWNYRGCVDKFGNLMPGSWIAIYRYYFDTYNPHTCPWEMLGFTSEPSWWTSEYGTNYGKGNTTLWNDLETGTIRQGPRAGVDARYARPGLSSVIPVDTNGNLLDPISANIIIQPPAPNFASRNWMFGDEGPVEHLWRTSSSYYYSKAIAAFLMKPSRYVETFWDSVNNRYLGKQWVNVNTLQRPIIIDTTLVHGEIIENTGVFNVVTGIQQWLVDNLVYAGKTPSLLGNAIRGIDVNLIYQMGAFVDSSGITAQTDNFGLIPSENINVTLYQGPPKLSTTYSGVIIEWNGYGYRVIGYDSKNPFFTIIPPNTSMTNGVISIDNDKQTIYDWKQNTFYRIGVYVEYENVVYVCIKTHSSKNIFDQTYWTISSKINTSPSLSVVTYTSGMNYTMNIPYGFVFNTIQQVSDFLLSWERYLVSQGWIFASYQASVVYDWANAVRDFLIWSQTKWSPGNFIALSPGANNLKFATNNGTILNVENATTGFFGLLNRSGQPIKQENVRVNRLDGQIELSAIDNDIFACTINVSDIEHMLVFSNTTIFNDIIYTPLYNQKQSRILLSGYKSSNWSGRLDAPGYIVDGNKMTSNFEKNPEDIRLMFDIEEASRPDLKQYARYNIGYQQEDFLENLLINQVEQFEFYQGMISQKGTPTVFDKLLRSQRVTAKSSINFLEEWAIRYPNTFGSPINPLASFYFFENQITADPQYITFNTPNIASQTWHIVSQSDWIDKPTATSFFNNTSSYINTKTPTAGFVRLSDVQYVVTNPNNLQPYYTNQLTLGDTVFNTGERIWIYQMDESLWSLNQSNINPWDVLRVFDVGCNSTGILGSSTVTISNIIPPSSSNQYTRIFVNGSINLTQNEIGNYLIIQGSSNTNPNLNGLVTIMAYDNTAMTIDISYPITQGYDFATSTGVVSPTLKILKSVLFADNNSIPNYNWLSSDLVWTVNINNNTTNYQILSYETGQWIAIRNQPQRIDPSTIKTSSVYNNATTIDTSNNKMMVTTPLIDDFAIVDPIMGYFPGNATKEIDFRTNNDPADYSVTNGWYDSYVGKVWWDMSTVFYLDPYTDSLGNGDTRDFAELTYRSTNWATLAPQASVDVYEWIKTTMTPIQYANAAANDTTGTYGEVYNSSFYTSKTVFSNSLNMNVTYYYYWVKNIKTIPAIKPRSVSVYDMATLLTNPVSEGITWLAPISPNGFLISGVSQFLNSTSSVVKIELNNNSNNVVHTQWTLLRPKDESSLPPEWLWRKIRDSLAGFANDGTPIPNIGNVTDE